MIRFTFHFVKQSDQDKDCAPIDVTPAEADNICDTIAHHIDLGNVICPTNNSTVPFVNLNQLKIITCYPVPEETEQAIIPEIVEA